MLKNFLIWSVAIALSTISAASAFGAIAKDKAPALALSMFVNNGYAAETLAADQVIAFIGKNRGKFPGRADRSSSNLALQAYKSEPVSPDAVAVIALSCAGNVQRDLMRKALNLSRRQPLVTGWLIADSKERGDVQNVLKLYDTVLRTSWASADVILPALTSSLKNDDFIKPLSSILLKEPPWAARFWTQVVGSKEALGNAARLRQMLYKPNDRDELYQDKALINALVYDGQFMQAEKLYKLLSRLSNSTQLVRNGDFRSNSEYAPIDWQLFSTGEYGADIIDGQLHLSAISNSGGLFARQIVNLPNGILSLRAEFDNGGLADGLLYIGLSCAENRKDETRINRFPLSGKSFYAQIKVQDSACQYYWLDIGGRSLDDGKGFDVAIDSVSIDNK